MSLGQYEYRVQSGLKYKTKLETTRQSDKNKRASHGAGI